MWTPLPLGRNHVLPVLYFIDLSITFSFYLNVHWKQQVICLLYEEEFTNYLGKNEEICKLKFPIRYLCYEIFPILEFGFSLLIICLFSLLASRLSLVYLSDHHMFPFLIQRLVFSFVAFWTPPFIDSPTLLRSKSYSFPT